MINSLITFCENRAAVTAAIVLFSVKLAEVKAKMVLINGLNLIAMGARDGVRLDTQQIRTAMTNLAFKCANATFAYANEVKDTVLREKVKLTMTDFTGMKKEDVDELCEKVYVAANAHAAEVVNYGVVATDISDLLVAIGLYRTNSQRPREAQITAGQAIKQSEILIRELIDDLLIGQMDAMANTLRFENNEFWRGYFQARIIINIGTTHTKVRGTVKTEEDVPLVGVLFRIMETGTENEVARVFTKVKGVFSANNLPAGDFDLEWSFDGYETVKEVGVRLSAGKELKRVVVMEPSSGNVTVYEGSLEMGLIGNVRQGVITNPDATVKLEAIGQGMIFFASNSLTGTPTGGQINVMPGMPVEMKVSQLAAQINWNAMNPFLNVQVIGMVQGGWKVTVTE